MNTYQKLQQKVLGLAFILGPLFLAIGAVIFLLGIGRSFYVTGSPLEGIFMFFGSLMMVPVFLELARILGQRAPIFGIICAITGLSWVVIIVPAVARLMEVDIIKAGLNVPIFTVIGGYPGWLPIFITLGLGLFASVLLGIGLLWKGGIPRWAAVLLIPAPIFFFLGNDGREIFAWWVTNPLYLLGCVAWLMALAPIGLRYLTGGSQAYELKMATA